tara:strand:- start:6754 stop:6906 length:153 start_codon:yes stop_codon:yes gene_type:complete
MATFKVEEVIENEDGSAQLILDMDSEMLQLLIEHAVTDILTKAVEKKHDI